VQGNYQGKLLNFFRGGSAFPGGDTGGKTQKDELEKKSSERRKKENVGKRREMEKEAREKKNGGLRRETNRGL